MRASESESESKSESTKSAAATTEIEEEEHSDEELRLFVTVRYFVEEIADIELNVSWGYFEGINF